MSKDVLIVATLASFVACFEMNDISILQDMGYTVHLAANFKDHRGDDYFKYFSENNVVTHQIDFQRSPLKPSNFKLVKKLKSIIESGNFALIHCHTPVGGVMARLAANKYRKTGLKVIYTAHGFHFCKGAPLRNWIIFYPVEKYLSSYCDAIITINKEDYSLAKNKFHSHYVFNIPGVGSDCSAFYDNKTDKKKFRGRLGLNDDDIMVLSVGELSARKNHQVIIKAIKELNQTNIHYFIAGDGALAEQLQHMVNELNLEKQVHLLGYAKEVEGLLKSADIFAFPSRHEGLGIALLEAMATGLPCVATRVQGICDLIKNDKMLNKYDDVNGFAESLRILIDDRNYAKKEGDFNKRRSADFDIKKVDKLMRDIYQNILR